jgi:acrylyl-CoA reductase (NADPH)
MVPELFRCLLVDKSTTTAVSSTTIGKIISLPSEQLPAGDVTIRSAYSSLNYKDALAYQGHRGIVKQLPHVPGIDVAGVVVESSDERFNLGDPVIVTGYELGQSRWGGWAELVRVPADWIVPLPSGLSLREAMIIGTAGFTAAQSVLALQRNEVEPSSGEVVVTGATGGVGSIAVRLLAHLGYEVVAITGKADQQQSLIQLGAKRALARSEILDVSERPLLSARWAGAVDTVGGDLLTSLLRSTRYGGCVTACGLVAGAELSMTVYPFLLRGVSLCGIASADCPAAKRQRIWELLAGNWKPGNLEEYVTEVQLEQLPREIDKISAGQLVGRVIVKIAGD